MMTAAYSAHNVCMLAIVRVIVYLHACTTALARTRCCSCELLADATARLPISACMCACLQLCMFSCIFMHLYAASVCKTVLTRTRCCACELLLMLLPGSHSKHHVSDACITKQGLSLLQVEKHPVKQLSVNSQPQ